MLASGSQDNYVRLWRISPVQQSQSVQVSKTAREQDANGLDLLDEFERKLAGEAGGSVQISTKAHMLSVEENGQ
jgi:elongator complex protein 2